uniref:putative uncharacterized protein C8orf89 homolog isoform X3 n=1 Tax=Monopterus albus TaxID=43700 RepID=UPI0009B38F4B|nr:60S ribosomal protein L7 isoform X3 [Monopterus albus]
MMIFQVNSSLPTLKASVSLRSSNSEQCGLDTAGRKEDIRIFGMGSGGGTTFLQNSLLTMKFPLIQPLSRARLERARTVIPPLPRDYHVHRPGNLHPLSLSKEFSRSHARRPLVLGYADRFGLNTTSAILFPSTLSLRGRNTFSVESCKLSRPKVNHPTENLLIDKDNHKSQSYPDPMVRASRSFIDRISELAALEVETVKQEKLKKMRKSRKLQS